MTQKLDSPQEWLEEVPLELHQLMAQCGEAALKALQKHTPYHSIKIAESYHLQAGRVLGWCVSATTQKGWEYESATMNSKGDILLMFKNPYVFS